VVAALHVHRLQDQKGRAELHESSGIARRILEIDDHCIVGVARISHQKRGSAQHFVGPGVTPARSAEV
jgi:hypothetical protein